MGMASGPAGVSEMQCDLIPSRFPNVRYGCKQRCALLIRIFIPAQVFQRLKHARQRGRAYRPAGRSQFVGVMALFFNA